MFQKPRLSSGDHLSASPPQRTRSDIARIRQNGRHLADLFHLISDWIRPGVSGRDINDFVRYYLSQRGLNAVLEGYRDFNATCCVSVGPVAVHGVPDEKPIPSGELVTVDVAVERDGWFADAAWTFAVGPISPDSARLLKGAYAACLAGVSVIKEGTGLRTLARTIQKAADAYGLHVMTECCGHAVGRELHEPPVIPYWSPRESPKESEPRHGDIILRNGHVITVEPVLSLVPQDLSPMSDGGGLRGSKGVACAQFEHTVAVGLEHSKTLTAPSAPDVDFPPFF